MLDDSRTVACGVGAQQVQCPPRGRNKAHYHATLGGNRWQEFYLRGKNHIDVALSADRANVVTAFAYLQSAMSLAETARESGVADWDCPVADLLRKWQQVYSGLHLLLGSNLAPDSVRQTG
ncbi:hypothetical protein [Streptomyces sp. NPDC001966]